MLMSQVSPAFKAGATPATFDGASKLTLHAEAIRARLIQISHSLSAYTTDEGGSGIFKITHGGKERFFPANWGFHSGPATNSAVYGMPPTLIPCNFKLSGGGLVQVDVTSTGGTQTGTLDGHVGIQYEAKGGASADVLAKSPLLVAVADGRFEYDAVAATTRQVLDGINTTTAGRIDAPEGARELVGLWLGVFKDGAVTAAQQVDGYIDIQANFDIGYQEYVLPSILPGLGTEVEGGAPSPGAFYPMSIPLPAGRASFFQIYANLHEAVTASVQVVAWLGFR